MKPSMRETRIYDSLDRPAARIGYSIRVTVIGLVSLFGTLMAPPSTVFGLTMADYTAVPHFLSLAIPTNLVIVLDFSDPMLRASYGNYPMSNFEMISSNVNGSKLCNTNTDTSTNPQPAGCPTANAPADVFDSSTEYFGIFSPFRCYTGLANIFKFPTVKNTVSSSCNGSQWDGNFLNWVSTRSLDAAKKVIIGSKSLAAANTGGTVNSLLAEDKTGQNGSTNSCGTSSKPCFRFVKKASGAGNRYPTDTPKDNGNISYFGIGEGKIYVKDASNVDSVFGSSTKYTLKVDLTTETDEFKKEQSLGILQTMRTDTLRLSVMFMNTGKRDAAKVMTKFDETLNAADITGIRNQPATADGALAESTYEALCYYRNSQGPCYVGGSPNFTASPDVKGDPFYFEEFGQVVACCKNFIFLISSGQPQNDGEVPDGATPFGDLFTTDNFGLSTTALDDVALYGKTNDIRDQASGSPGYLVDTQNVSFYAVNTMGDAAGAALLASGAMYGGFEDKNGNNVPDLTGQTCTYPANSTLGSGTGTSNAEWDLDQDCVPDTFFDAPNGSDLKAAIERAINKMLDESASGAAASVLATSSTGEGTIYQAFFFPAETKGINKEIKWTGYTQGLFLDTFGNLREDTDGDARLILEKDRIIKTRLDTSTNDVKVDRFKDDNGDGVADSSTPFETVGLKDTKNIWEAGRRLALTDPSARTIKTWVDKDNDGLVDNGEVIDFTTLNSSTLDPYLRANGQYTADNIINFIRGTQVAGFRDRQLTVKNDSGASVLKVWKYGDPVNSAPTVVGRPSERFDVIYGDDSYREFVVEHKDRRQVVYVGANDGMLHAFNGGYYHAGDDPNTSDIEHGYYTTKPTSNTSGKLLGEELWGFIPQELLPHLQWLADPNYTHVYYVDLKPKVTDVRIFCDTGGGAPSPCVTGQVSTTHNNGWGTILIGGMRLGGSCKNCAAATGAPEMKVTADFDGDGSDEDRIFYSAYFVLDITNPEKDPKLLWSFSHGELALTTSYPAVVRVNPSASAKTDNTNAKWYVLIGSGPTSYNGTSTQTGKIFAIDLIAGPKNSSGIDLFTEFQSGASSSFMADLISLDADLDYRADVVYGGNVINNGVSPDWAGTLNRLTTGDPADSTTFGTVTTPSTWGYGNKPTVVLADFACSTVGCTGPNKVGPIVASPTVTMDDSGKIWVFFGTGRFISVADKTNTDTQYFFGVKDPVLTGGCTQTGYLSCEQKDLVNVSSAKICLVCDTGTNQVEGVSGVTTFDGTGTTSLIGLVQSKDGWYTTLPATGERNLNAPTLLGGTVFFTTFVPVTDVCSGRGGDGFLYALFYLTGSAYTESMIGTETVGGNTNLARSISLGSGLPSQMAIQIGARGTGASGTISGSGCTGQVTGFIQTSSGALSQVCGKPALSSWSRYITWLGQRVI